MELFIIILIAIIFILLFYLFLLKKEIKRVALQLKEIGEESTNLLLNQEFDEKNMKELLKQINKFLKTTQFQQHQVYFKNEQLRKMIVNIAHDLRTPLTSALGYIDLIKNENLTTTQKNNYLLVTQERLNRLSDLITSFFDFSKIVLKENKIDLKQENLIALIEDRIGQFYDDFSRENRKIKFSNEHSKIELFTNKMLLTRIFDNLITNAYKHSQSDLKIIVSNNDDHISMQFQNVIFDNDFDINCIFDEFYTSDISRTKGSTGLGLTIVKEFVDLLKGTIDVAERDSSLIFTIVFQRL